MVLKFSDKVSNSGDAGALKVIKRRRSLIGKSFDSLGFFPQRNTILAAAKKCNNSPIV